MIGAPAVADDRRPGRFDVFLSTEPRPQTLQVNEPHRPGALTWSYQRVVQLIPLVREADSTLLTYDR